MTPRRRIRGIAIAVVLAAAGAAVAGTLGLGGSGDADAQAGQPASTAVTVIVERRTLTRSASIDGKIDYGASTPLPIKAAGTITWLPAPGTVIKRGQPLLRVDDRPVVLLYGALPQYRELAAARKPTLPAAPEPTASEAAATVAARGGTGTEAPAPTTAPRTAKPTPTTKPPPAPPFTGNDVEQFERNLRTLGYSGFEVDTTFSDATTRAVKRWQRDLGLPPTGTVGLGDVVYAAGAVRIAKTNARVGDAVSDDTVTVSGNNRVVTAAAPTESLAWAKKGARVSVQVPDGGKTAGTVTSVGVPSQGDGEGGDTTVPVTVIVTDQKKLTGQEGATVTVMYVAEQRKDVLCVPVPALVALAEGGYGLQTAGPGAGGFIAVKTGMFADGVVEVSGAGLHEGTTVRAPK